MSPFTSNLAPLYVSCYDLFQVQTALTDVSFLSGPHTSTAVGNSGSYYDCSSLFVLGGSISVNTLIFAASGLTLCLEITSPRNGMHVPLKKRFSLFSIRLPCLHL